MISVHVCLCACVCVCLCVEHWSWNHTQLQSWASFSPKSFCIIYDSLSAAKLPSTTKTPLFPLPSPSLSRTHSLSPSLSLKYFILIACLKMLRETQKSVRLSGARSPLPVGRWQANNISHTTHTHTSTHMHSTSRSQSLCPFVRPYLSSKGKNEARVVLTQCVMYYTGIWLFIPWIYTCLHARSACTATSSFPSFPSAPNPWHSSLNK